MTSIQTVIPPNAYVINRNASTFAYLRVGDSNTYLGVDFNFLRILLPSYNLQLEIPQGVRFVGRNDPNHSRVICYCFVNNEYKSLSVIDLCNLNFAFGEPREI